MEYKKLEKIITGGWSNEKSKNFEDKAFLKILSDYANKQNYFNVQLLGDIAMYDSTGTLMAFEVKRNSSKKEIQKASMNFETFSNLDSDIVCKLITSKKPSKESQKIISLNDTLVIDKEESASNLFDKSCGYKLREIEQIRNYIKAYCVMDNTYRYSFESAKLNRKKYIVDIRTNVIHREKVMVKFETAEYNSKITRSAIEKLEDFSEDDIYSIATKIHFESISNKKIELDKIINQARENNEHN